MALLFFIVKMNAAERVGVVFARGCRGQQDRVIGAQAGRGIDGVRVAAAELDPLLGTRDEASATFMEDVETFEVDVGAIHHVEGTGFWRDGIEDVDVVPYFRRKPQ